MPSSVLEAIQLGLWDYEPETVESHSYDQTGAMPGTREKIEVLADRLRNGLPLWHPSDRSSFDDFE